MEDRKINQVEYANLLSYLLTVYLQNNKVEHYSLPDLIRNVNESLSDSIRVDPSKWHFEAAPAERTVALDDVDDADDVNSDALPAGRVLPTAQAISDSIGADYLISFEDGKKYKTLTRHLGKLGLTPEEYRKKWGLPRSYPMMCETTRSKRSAVAIKSGLAGFGNRARQSARKNQKRSQS